MSNGLLTDLANRPIIAAQGGKFLFCPRRYAESFYLSPRICSGRIDSLKLPTEVLATTEVIHLSGKLLAETID